MMQKHFMADVKKLKSKSILAFAHQRDILGDLEICQTTEVLHNDYEVIFFVS